MHFVLYLLIILCASSTCQAESPAASNSSLQTIDQQIEILSQQLHEARLKAMQEEINSQPLMFEEWGKFAKHIKNVEAYETEAERIQNEIDQLKEQRQRLIDLQPPSQP
jgi:hypothetical protein